MKVLGLVWLGCNVSYTRTKKRTRGLVCIDHKEMIKCSDLYLSLRDIYFLVFILKRR